MFEYRVAISIHQMLNNKRWFVWGNPGKVNAEVTHAGQLYQWHVMQAFPMWRRGNWWKALFSLITFSSPFDFSDSYSPPFNALLLSSTITLFIFYSRFLPSFSLDFPNSFVSLSFRNPAFFWCPLYKCFHIPFNVGSKYLKENWNHLEKS